MECHHHSAIDVQFEHSENCVKLHTYQYRLASSPSCVNEDLFVDDELGDDNTYPVLPFIDWG